MELQAEQPGAGKAGPPATGRRRNHIFAWPKRHVHSRKSKGETSFEAIARLLYEYDLDAYPGRTACMLALFQHRASKWAIYKWRRGTRRAPQWARDILITELKKKAAAYLAAAAELENDSQSDMR